MDVFISYEHQSKSIADNICAVLESKGIRCWYAPRDVYGDYATSIVEAIENCKVFVLILNGTSSNSPHVLNEVEMAYQRILNGEIVIVPFKVDEGVLSKAMEYYVKRLHWIDAVSAPLESAIDQLYEQLVPILGITKVTPETAAKDLPPEETNIVRKNVKYYSADDAVEVHRLQLEEQLLYDYDKIWYDDLLRGREHVIALDFGTLNPHCPYRRLSRPEIDKAICLAYDENVVAEGKGLTEGDDKFEFYKFDVTVDSFDELMLKITAETGVEKFDFLTLSLSVMDLQNPFKTLKRIRKYMNPDGIAFVRDVDDGVVFAYPDDNGYFEQFKEFYKLDTLSGSRHSGRQIHYLMKKLGAVDIRLKRCGINSAGMTYKQKRLLFESWFSFIPNDFRLILKKDPNNETAKKVLAWVDEYYDDLEEQFFSEEFIFNSGYVIYTVRF